MTRGLTIQLLATDRNLCMAGEWKRGILTVEEWRVFSNLTEELLIPDNGTYPNVGKGRGYIQYCKVFVIVVVGWFIVQSGHHKHKGVRA
jgi:hypothetical protein